MKLNSFKLISLALTLLLLSTMLVTSAISAATNPLWAWGYNHKGQLGYPLVLYLTEPIQVNGLYNMVAIEANGGHSLALKSDSTVWTWGWNIYSQLGIDPTVGERATPDQVDGLMDVIEIAAGRTHNLVLKSNGNVWSWGANSRGQLGAETTELTQTNPVQVGFFDNLYRSLASFVLNDYNYLANHLGGLRIINITDKTNPVEVGYDDFGSVNNVYVSGDYTYVSSAGVKIYDITDKTNPILVDTWLSSSTGVFVDYPYIYSASGSSGLYIGEIQVTKALEASRRWVGSTYPPGIFKGCAH